MRELIVRLCRFSVLPALVMAGSAFADTGTIVNALGVPIVYRVGIPDAQGNVDWQQYSIGPCEEHQYSWDQSGEPNLALLYPKWIDLRRDEAGNIVMERNAVRMAPEGARTVFFLYGDQVWIDTAGNPSPCDQQGATTGQEEGNTQTEGEQPQELAATESNDNGALVPEQAVAADNQQLQELIDWLSGMVQREANGEILLVPVDLTGNGGSPIYAPLLVDRFSQLVILKQFDGSLSTPEAVDLLQRATLLSHAAAREYRNRRDRLQELLQANLSNAPR